VCYAFAFDLSRFSVDPATSVRQDDTSEKKAGDGQHDDASRQVANQRLE